MPSTPVQNRKSKPIKEFKVTVTKKKDIGADLSDLADNSWTVQLTPIDDIMPRGYFQLCYFYKNVKNKKDFMQKRKIKHALSEALRYFPVLSGRLSSLPDGGFVLNANNSGVQFLHAHGDFTMAELELSGRLDAANLPEGLTPSPIDVPYLLRIQVTYLRDNSVVLVALFNHNVCDGPAAFTFMRAWAEITADRSEDLTVLEVEHGRAALYPDFKPVRYRHDEFKLYNNNELEDKEYRDTLICTFKFTADQLSKIRSSSGDVECAVTNINILCAIFWKYVSIARGLKGSLVSTVGTAVNGRYKLKPPLPKGYFGNATFYAMAHLEADDLQRLSVPEIAIQIHEAEDAITDDYVRSAINFIESSGDKSLIGPKIDCCYGNDLAISSWANFPVLDTDFGDGKPFSFKVPMQAVDGVMMILPQKEDGNVEVCLGLIREHMNSMLSNEEFKHFCY